MFQLKYKTLLNLILLFSIFALGAAYFVQYILKHEPCNLCLIERLPYIFSILVIILLLIIQKYERYAFILLSLIFIIATILSFYHFGIEQGFFKESAFCFASNETSNLSSEELLNELQKKTISCRDVSFKFFGLSLTSINMFASIALSIITIKAFLNYEKNR